MPNTPLSFCSFVFGKKNRSTITTKVFRNRKFVHTIYNAEDKTLVYSAEYMKNILGVALQFLEGKRNSVKLLKVLITFFLLALNCNKACY